jgi:hypothetical protein
MGEVAVLVAIAVLATIMLSLAVMGATWRRIQLRNEVSPQHRLRPPTNWLASPTACGRLHRRLRSAVAALHLVLPVPRRRRHRRRETSALEDLAREIEAQAIALDRDLIVVDRLRGPAATTARKALAEQVGAIEVLTHRVTAAVQAAERAPGTPPTPEALAAVAARLDLLDGARFELARIEAHTTMAPGWSTARTFTDAPSG